CLTRFFAWHFRQVAYEADQSLIQPVAGVIVVDRLLLIKDVGMMVPLIAIHDENEPRAGVLSQEIAGQNKANPELVLAIAFFFIIVCGEHGLPARIVQKTVS